MRLAGAGGLRHGFREYYNPLTGRGLGARGFGFATLLVDLLAECGIDGSEPSGRRPHDATVSWRSTRAAGQSGHSPRQVAVVDLGSNSWRLVVFTYESGSWWKLTDELYETVRIGAGLAASGKLSYEAIGRGLETLGVFARFCRANHLDAEDIHVVATSAIRDATNGERFLADAQAATGLTIETLSAQEEAYYGYVAAVNTTTLTDGVVLDIGGGSMQLTHVDGRRPAGVGLVPARRRARHRAVPPRRRPRQEEGPVQAARSRRRDGVDAGLADLLGPADGGHRGRGAQPGRRRPGGQRLARSRRPGLRTSPRRCSSDLAAELASMSVEERGMVPGIKPGRGDIILASAVVLDTVVSPRRV